MLSTEEKHELLSIARQAIECRLNGLQFSPDVFFEGNLSHPRGAFVTIRIDPELRGCIGYIESDQPLVNVVAEVAAKAATGDPRFSPLTLQELDAASIEISVLSSLRRIFSIDEIEIGTHGLVAVMGTDRGLLLPQVAVEHAFDKEAFVEATMLKAAIPFRMRHSPELEIFVFETEVLHEATVLQ